MPLGMEVGLDPGHIVLDEDPASPLPRKGRSSRRLFGPCLLWPQSYLSYCCALVYVLYCCGYSEYLSEIACYGCPL